MYNSAHKEKQNMKDGSQRNFKERILINFIESPQKGLKNTHTHTQKLLSDMPTKQGK